VRCFRFAASLVIATVASAAAAEQSAEQSARLTVLTSTGVTRDGLPVLAPHPSPAEMASVLERGFSGKLLRLYALEQEFLRRKTGITPEPAYLLLSDRQGGFPQFGFHLGDTTKAGVGWVDLHKSSRLTGRFGATDQVFPHELMHVIVRQLAGAPRESGGNQVHAIGVRTDPVNAFAEGLAETMQILAVDDPEAADDTRALAGDRDAAGKTEHDVARYSRDLTRRWWPVQPARMRFLLWFSASEQVQRYHAVKANRFARMPAVPDALLDREDTHAAYLLSNVMPGGADGAIKPAAVMLSSEGVVSHLFWRVITDRALRERHEDAAFYAQFGVTPAGVTPMENVFLKLFVALYEGRPSTAAELLRAYAERFPADAVDVDRVTREALLGQSLPDAPEVWLLNAALVTGTSLFDQYRALPRPHTFDANAATLLDWIGVPGVRREHAAALVAGAPYATLDALLAKTPASLRPQVTAMAEAMWRLRSRAADEEETLSLTVILTSYIWRLLGLAAITTMAGAWLARRAGARRIWTATLTAMAGSLLVIALAWVIVSPPWYPYAAPVVIGGLPWALWRAVRGRPGRVVAQPLLIWALASVPALLATMI
jgi:hypothetical protein